MAFELQHNLGIDGPLWQIPYCKLPVILGAVWSTVYSVGTHKFGISQTSSVQPKPGSPEQLGRSVCLSGQSDTASTQSIRSQTPMADRQDHHPATPAQSGPLIRKKSNSPGSRQKAWGKKPGVTLLTVMWSPLGCCFQLACSSSAALLPLGI